MDLDNNATKELYELYYRESYEKDLVKRYAILLRIRRLYSNYKIEDKDIEDKDIEDKIFDVKRDYLTERISSLEEELIKSVLSKNRKVSDEIRDRISRAKNKLSNLLKNSNYSSNESSSKEVNGIERKDYNRILRDLKKDGNELYDILGFAIGYHTYIEDFCKCLFNFTVSKLIEEAKDLAYQCYVYFELGYDEDLRVINERLSEIKEILSDLGFEINIDFSEEIDDDNFITAIKKLPEKITD